MAEIKTKITDASVAEFIESFANTDQKKKDSYEMIRIMQEYTGFEPKMWTLDYRVWCLSLQIGPE